MDFYSIKCKKDTKTKGHYLVYPDFKVCRSKDLMIKGKAFYAIWDETRKLWSTDEFDVQRLVDDDIRKTIEEHYAGDFEMYSPNYMADFSSGSWKEFRKYVQNLSDNAHELDGKIIFADKETDKKDYATRKLSYIMKEGPIDAYEELISKLYAPEEREKFEWAIGSIINGASRDIQKFLVFYGPPGSGKSTVMNIIFKLFDGYCTVFDAKALVSSGNQFATEAFRSNPLIGIQHDGDLSRIEDNAKINSIISHEAMIINEKYKATYTSKVNAMLFMGTNKPVRISDSKSGIIRRLIDVNPTGDKHSTKRYNQLIGEIDFEIGAIAKHCLDVFLKLGSSYYNSYRPISMMFKTDVFFNFMEDNYSTFAENDGIQLRTAYNLYKAYCQETNSDYVLPLYKFREELKNYFWNYEEDVHDESGNHVRKYFSNFKKEKFNLNQQFDNDKEEVVFKIEETKSILDKELQDMPAQYASQENETPNYKWLNVKTKLKDLDTSKLHYVKVPENHIVIDFDLKDENGNKNYQKNIEAASKWPKTYAELSKSGKGVHLHYIYDGDVSKLSRIYDENIEIKVFTGNSSLRRKLSKCNKIPIATISSGLPLKKEKDSMLNVTAFKNEQFLRTMIEKNLRKEIHPNTKPSVDFIYKLLEDAYNSGAKYDVTDLSPKIMAFANNSTHQAKNCLDIVAKMHFKSEEISVNNDKEYVSNEYVFFDVEVFPNLFICCWKLAGEKNKVVKMINPSPADIAELVKYKLIGFNCRRYDNHILYGRMIGESNEELYKRSHMIVSGSRNGFAGEAYNISYADIYDFTTLKQSLKKYEIELGLHHIENEYPWDQPLAEEHWDEVADYCCNDVLATEATFNSRHEDFVAREILAEISGLSVNDTTRTHTAKIIFGNDRDPQTKFVYTDLSTGNQYLGGEEIDRKNMKKDICEVSKINGAKNLFKGYTFDCGKSVYMGEEVGEGGYVYSEPGMYNNVALLDIASMHPNSLINLNLFGEYTSKFKDILDARIAIKHKDFEAAGKMFDGKLKPYLEDKSKSKDLAYALKIVINSVYGFTSATFENKFKDPRNVDNIVAKRGALFMINLKKEVQKKGFTVAHIKTDSIKIPDATPEIIQFVMDYGKEYGYTFEHEATYEKMCLVNDAVYIAKYVKDKEEHEFELSTGEKVVTNWTATGTQFQIPYVFKTLFSKSKINFKDMCEIKTVTSSFYLDMNEEKPNVALEETAVDKLKKAVKDNAASCKIVLQNGPEILKAGEYEPKIDKLNKIIEKGHDYHFVGKASSFCPIKDGCGGGILVRLNNNKYDSATGCKGYRWLESVMVKELHKENDINRDYYNNLVDEAVKVISQYGDFEKFAS